MKLVIKRTSSGEIVFSGVGSYTSWCEITSPKVCRKLVKGEEIRVTASSPSAAQKKSK